MQLTITLIQTHLHWEDKAANLQMLEAKIRSINEPTQVVVLPEMFSTGFSMNARHFAEKMDGYTVNWMQHLAAEKRCIITGSAIIEEQNNFYNRLLWVLPNGHTGWYNKRHLFAFAGENEHYTPGQKRVIASVNGWKINLQVCYDLRFPVWSRQTPEEIQEELKPPIHVAGQKVTLSYDGETRNEINLESQLQVAEPANAVAAPEYDLLLYVANWPERRNYAWKNLLTARAIENQCYVVAVNRIGEDGNGIYHSGDSCVIDPLGSRLYDKEHGEDIFTITLDKTLLHSIREKYPFWMDADSFVLK